MRRILLVIALSLSLPWFAFAEPIHYDEAVDPEIHVIEGVGYTVTLTLAPGINTVTGTIGFDGTTRDRDPFNLIIEEGQQIESISFAYNTTIFANPGTASFNFYIDGTGIIIDSLPPVENVQATGVPSDDREFYPDLMPLGDGLYSLGRAGSAETTIMEYEVAYTWTIVVSGDEPPPPVPDISIDDASFCVDDEYFNFDVTVTGEAGEMILRIGADTDPGVTPNERIDTHFGAVTGEILSEQAPIAESYGSPPYDRWLDGAVDGYQIMSVGGTTWQYTGRVPHGTGRFLAGDSLWGVSLAEGAANVSTGPLQIAACPPKVTKILVPQQRGAPPTIDGQLFINEWRGPFFPQLQFPNGSITFVHDLTRLYLLVNMRGDRSNNGLVNGGPDQMWIFADVDEDGAITPNVDRRYRMLSNTGNFRYETYAPLGGPPLNPPVARSFSAAEEGFGCFFADRSIDPLTFTCDAHRVWEIGLDLLELQAMEDQTIRLGFLVQSELNVVQMLPQDLTDLAQFIEIEIQGKTAITERVGPPPVGLIDSLEMRVTQGVQTAANSLDLVASRDTYVDVLAISEPGPESPIATVFVSRDGIDALGAPYTNYLPLRYSSEREPPLEGRWRFLLNDDPAAGDVDFTFFARQPILKASTTGPTKSISFVDTVTPTYWIVPINTGDGPPSLPSTRFLDRQELETRAAFPVADINFVRRPIISGNPDTKVEANAFVNQYDQTAGLAWVLGLLITGEPPFDLPDQVIGAFSAAKNFGTTIGRADPAWIDGAGRTLWIKDTVVEGGLLLAHEINHNLDLDTSGNWGRHIMGCGADGIDPQWPYTTFEIQEPSLLTEPVVDNAGFSLMPTLDIDATTPDYMSYCRADFDFRTSSQRAYPYQWISPYRWQIHLDQIFGTAPATLSAARAASLSSATATALPTVQDSLYISGNINIDGTGSLNPVLRQPGILRASQRPGDFEIRLANCDGSTAAVKSLGASFIDVEGEPRDTHPFALVLPDSSNLCAVQLRRGATTLAEQVASPNPPQVEIISPNGGEAWDGEVTIDWLATDADGGTLTAALFYSPDAGSTWLPIEGNIDGSQYALDSASLPGSDTALIRIVVTDGLNTVSDTSDGIFSVAPKAPSVSIFGPGPGSELFAGELQTYRGMARDPQGQSLPDDGFIWLLDGEPVGLGNPLKIVLEPGAQQLALQTQGDNGLIGMATLDLPVSDYDADGDRVPDDVDACPASVLSSTISIGDCVTEVPNRLLANGCFVAETLNEILETDSEKAAKKGLKSMHKDGYLEHDEAKAVEQCLKDKKVKKKDKKDKDKNKKHKKG